MFNKGWQILFGLLLLVGAILIVVATAWHGLSVYGAGFWRGEGLIGIVIVLLAGYTAYRGWSDKAKTAKTEMDFNDTLMLTGYALLFAGVICCTLVAGLVYTEKLEHSGPAFNEAMVDSSDKRLAMLVVLSAVTSIFGALFFVANSLRKKRDTQEPFDEDKFWGGLTFRLGEAVLFSLVVFWLIWRGATNTPATATHAAGGSATAVLDYTWLPLLSLLLGMFVTSGERLIFAIAQGLFRAVGAFFGVESPNIPNGAGNSGASKKGKTTSSQASTAKPPEADDRTQ